MGWYFSKACWSSSMARLWRVLLPCLLLPSILGIAVCHTSDAQIYARDEASHFEVLLPIESSVCDTSSEQTGAGEDFIGHVAEVGRMQSSTVFVYAIVTNHSLDVVSFRAHIALFSVGGVPPAFGVIVPRETTYLPELFASLIKRPPRAS